MGTITVQSVINKALILLQDDGTRYPLAECLGWFNEGQKAVVVLKPSAYTSNAPLKLVPGTKQHLAAGGLQLLDVPRNMGVNGDRPGRAVRLIGREQLDAQVPNWHAARQQPEIRHFTFDVNEPKGFYCYPPSNGNAYVDVLQAVTPPVQTAAEMMVLDDIFEGPLVSFIVARALMKEADYAADPGRANAFMAGFTQMVTGKNQSELAKDANADANSKPGSRPQRS